MKLAATLIAAACAVGLAGAPGAAAAVPPAGPSPGPAAPEDTVPSTAGPTAPFAVTGSSDSESQPAALWAGTPAAADSPAPATTEPDRIAAAVEPASNDGLTPRPAAPAGPAAATTPTPSVESEPPSRVASGRAATGLRSERRATHGEVDQPGVTSPVGASVAPSATAPMEATARNDSVTLQIVWQVQRGCRTHCYATSQTQVAEQVAETVQQVVAVATGGASDAMAANASRTVQLIVQRQIGCVAFCYGTSQRQLASQLATTVQIAIALGGGGASSNVGSTLQLSWQQQLGCRVHCYATWEGQGLSQAAMTSQTASAAGRADAGDGTSVSRDRGGRRPLRQRGGGAWAELRALVASLARNANVTVQVVRQVERSGCRSWCVGDTQVQLATEQASAAQDAAATVLGRRELAA